MEIQICSKEKMAKKIVIRTSIESTVKFAKRAWTKKQHSNLCDSWMILAYLNFKQQFDSMSYRPGV